jgi:hypothetical protein
MNLSDIVGPGKAFDPSTMSNTWLGKLGKAAALGGIAAGGAALATIPGGSLLANAAGSDGSGTTDTSGNDPLYGLGADSGSSSGSSGASGGINWTTFGKLLGAGVSVASALAGASTSAQGQAIQQQILNQLQQQRQLGLQLGQVGAVGNPFSSQYGSLFGGSTPTPTSTTATPASGTPQVLPVTPTGPQPQTATGSSGTLPSSTTPLIQQLYGRLQRQT